MECSIGRLEGCDQETLDSVTEMPGTTLQDLREMQYKTCGPCSMAVLEGCQQTGQDRDTICRYNSLVDPGFPRGAPIRGGEVRVQNFTTVCKSATATCWHFAVAVCIGEWGGGVVEEIPIVKLDLQLIFVPRTVDKSFSIRGYGTA